MTSGKAYIALIMLLIFAFPVAYQSVHTFQHQSESKRCHHGSCCSLMVPIQKGESIQALPEAEHCAICAYQFVVNDIPSNNDFVLMEHSLGSIQEHEIVLEVYIPALRKKSSRAPPSSHI